MGSAAVGRVLLFAAVLLVVFEFGVTTSAVDVRRRLRGAQRHRAGTAAGADRDLSLSAWDSVRQRPPNQATNGAMHWLREAYSSGNDGPVILGIKPDLLVGNGGMPAPGPVYGLDINPRVPPVLSHVQFRNVFLALSSEQAAWVSDEAAAFNALVALHAAPHVLSPFAGGHGLVDPFANCHADIVNALIQTGINSHVGGTTRDQATAALVAMHQHTCHALNVDLATLSPLTTAIAGNIAGWRRQDPARAGLRGYEALRDHYLRFEALFGSLGTPVALNTLDVWALRGWLYATDRANGHRLVGAVGWAEQGHPGMDEMQRNGVMLRHQDHDGTVHYGYALDTVGHVRPKAMGGQRDSMNFVPQSAIGQAIVAPAETLSRAIAANCHVNGKEARYTELFVYPGGGGQRRPSHTRTVVDLLHVCNHPALGASGFAAVSPLFDSGEQNTW